MFRPFRETTVMIGLIEFDIVPQGKNIQESSFFFFLFRMDD